MAETPQFPPDPQDQSEKFLDALRSEISFAVAGKAALQDEETSDLLVKEATPPQQSPNPKLLGMLLEREFLIDQLAAKEGDPVSLSDQLNTLNSSIYTAKVESGIEVADGPIPPLDTEQ